jgi:hypothetical protein
VIRLLAALIGFTIGYVWVRRRATARFRRRLRRQGLPDELADALAQDYRRMLTCWKSLQALSGSKPNSSRAFFVSRRGSAEGQKDSVE